jgi:hypothetical protein
LPLVPFFIGKAKGNFVSEIPAALPVNVIATKDYKTNNEFAIAIDIFQCIEL